MDGRSLVNPGGQGSGAKRLRALALRRMLKERVLDAIPSRCPEVHPGPSNDLQGARVCWRSRNALRRDPMALIWL